MFERELETLSGQTVTLEIEDKLYIDGEFVESNETFETLHPATEEVLADVPVATTEQVDEAVEAATAASHQFRELTMTERRERVETLADAVEERAEDLMTLEVADNGSSLARMQHDAGKGADALRYFAGLGVELKGEQVPTGSDTVDFTVREPYGAVGSILPFNHPLMFTLQRIGAAAVTGNGIVIKPSEYTSLSTLYMGRILDDIDVFPDGLVNLVTGHGEVGRAIAEHPDVGFVSFIGSRATGKKVMQSAATHLAPVMLGTGGKNPVIVFPDKDVDEAAQGATDAMSLAWQGQSCGSGTRLLVHEDVYDAVVERVVENFESLNVGDPFDESKTMGAIVSETQYENILGAIENAKAEGATLLCGGGPVEEYDRGYFVEPTVFEVDPDMEVVQTEIFGPVLSVMSWSDYDEMMAMANGTRYGLTASVWTDDLSTAHRAVGDLEAGYVWVNQHGSHYTGAPFGGYKESGIGKKDNMEVLLDHTRVKNVNIAFDDVERGWD